MATAWKTTARQIDREIQSVSKAVRREGKTDEIENQLDQIEHHIGKLGQSDDAKTSAKQLKDKLDKVK